MTARTLLRFVALYSLSAVPSQAGDDPRFNPVGNPGFAIADWQSKDKPPIIISVDGSPTIGTQDTKDAPDGGGALIGEVLPDTPAFKAGLKVGDRITVWKGQPVRTRQDWITLLEAGKTGDEVEFTYVRAGQPITAKASLTVRKGESSAPWEAGLRPGDVILSFGGQATPTAYDYSQIKEAYAAGESVEVRYRRGTEEHSTQLKLDFYEGEKDGTAAFKLTPGGGHGSPIQDMLVSPARREAVSYDNDGVFIIWGVDDMKPKKRFILPSGFGSVKRASLARDGRMLGLICAYGVKRSAFVVDLDRLDIAAYLPIPENRNDMRFEEIAIAPDSSTALCVQNLWDEKTLPLGETRLFLFDLEGAGLLKESAPCGVKPPVFIGGLRVFASPGTGTNPVYQGQAGLAALGVSDGTIHQWTLTRSASLQLDTKDSRLFNYRTDLPAIRKQASTLKPEDVIAPKNHPWRNVIKCWLQPLTLASSETGNLLAFCGKNYHTSVLRLTPDLKATHSWHRSALEGGYDLGEEAWFKMGVARYSQLNRQVRHVTLDGMGWVDSSTYHQIKPRNSVRQQRQIDFKDPDSVSDSTECPWRIISFPGSALEDITPLTNNEITAIEHKSGRKVLTVGKVNLSDPIDSSDSITHLQGSMTARTNNGILDAKPLIGEGLAIAQDGSGFAILAPHDTDEERDLTKLLRKRETRYLVIAPEFALTSQPKKDLSYSGRQLSASERHQSVSVLGDQKQAWEDAIRLAEPKNHSYATPLARIELEGKTSWVYALFVMDEEPNHSTRRTPLRGDSGATIVSKNHQTSYASRDGSRLYVQYWNTNRIDVYDTLRPAFLASCYVFEGGDWIWWTPEGFFAASPKAMEWIGWSTNQGIGHPAKYFTGDQMFNHFHRPDILQEVLSKGTPASVIAERLGLKFELSAVLRGVPMVELIGTKDGGKVGTPTLTVQAKATDVGGGIHNLEFFHNGKRLVPDGPPVRGDRDQTRSFTVNFQPGKNELRAVAYNEDKIMSTPATAVVDYNGSAATTTLHVLSVGINRYQNQRYSLNYCVADSDALQAALEKRGAGIFKAIKLHRIADDQATRPNIQAEFQKIAAEAEPQDMFVFIFAGDGVMSETAESKEPVFHLVPHDVTRLYGDAEMLAEKAVSAKQLEEWSAAIKAQKQLLLLDTCQSGGLVDTYAMRGAAEEKAIAQLSRATGTTVIASTGTEQYASEVKELGHGIFTYAILQALDQGLGDSNKDGKITVKELEAFVNDAVPELTLKHKGTAQYPNSYSRGQDFPVGVVK